MVITRMLPQATHFHGACSLGFPPKMYKNYLRASKIYDTRSGIDPDFPETLFDDSELQQIGEHGHEFGVTTGRKRKVNWLNLDKLIKYYKFRTMYV